jgi:hypothetical protein
MKLALALAAALLPACLANVSANSTTLGAGAPVYIACYKDGGPRDLPVWFCSNGTNGRDCYDDSRKKCGVGHWAGACDMTPVACAAQCAGFKFFGVQAGYACFCGDDYGKHGPAPESDCNMPCTGDGSIMCGGAGRNSASTPSQPKTNTADAPAHHNCGLRLVPLRIAPRAGLRPHRPNSRLKSSALWR